MASGSKGRLSQLCFSALQSIRKRGVPRNSDVGACHPFPAQVIKSSNVLTIQPCLCSSERNFLKGTGDDFVIEDASRRTRGLSFRP